MNGVDKSNWPSYGTGCVKLPVFSSNHPKKFEWGGYQRDPGKQKEAITILKFIYDELGIPYKILDSRMTKMTSGVDDKDLPLSHCKLYGLVPEMNFSNLESSRFNLCFLRSAIPHPSVGNKRSLRHLKGNILGARIVPKIIKGTWSGGSRLYLLSLSGTSTRAPIVNRFRDKVLWLLKEFSIPNLYYGIEGQIGSAMNIFHDNDVPSEYSHRYLSDQQKLQIKQKLDYYRNGFADPKKRENYLQLFLEFELGLG